MNHTRGMQRARTDEDKDERRRELLDAALALFVESSFPQVKMADVAKRARLSKGTVFVYFPTKESLFLALTDRELGAWADALHAELSEAGVSGSAQVATLVAQSLSSRKSLVRLMPLMTNILEHNVADAQIVELKLALLERILRVGAAFEARLPGLAAGGGARLVVRIYALVVGLQVVSELGPAAERALNARPELALLRLDFAAELESALADLLRGSITP